MNLIPARDKLRRPVVPRQASTCDVRENVWVFWNPFLPGYVKRSWGGRASKNPKNYCGRHMYMPPPDLMPQIYEKPPIL